MAYISKDEKNAKTLELRALGKEYNVTVTVARNNYSTIVLNISKGKIDFFNEYQCETGFFSDGEKYLTVNHYYLKDQFKTGSKSLEFLEKAFLILNAGNHNNSDSMADYFDVGFYIDINIGKFQKPYIFLTDK
jgi:hypothetical protein